MVFFTCNHCGESVKKPSVEKHYNFKCRGAPKNISCMDCQKDFHGEDYAAHTSCITEVEKYSGKDYVPKVSKNSGQKKQESWMDIIRSILDTKEYNLSNHAKTTFQKLQSVDNVPRKKAKFQNFVANCMRMRREQAEEVWSVLEKELEKIKASKASAPQSNGNTKDAANAESAKAEPEGKPEEMGVDDIAADQQPQPVRVKKSKKRKVDKEIQNTIELDEEKEILQTATEMAYSEPSKKKKRKKSDKSEESVAKQIEVNAEQEPTISTTTTDEFQWGLVMLCTVRKYGDSMKLDKLKRKVQRMYLSKREMEAFTAKQLAKFDKKFEKHLNKCNLKVNNDIVSVATKQAAGDK